MEFNAGAAVIAGLAGGAVMTALIYMGLGMFPNQMRMNILRLLGTMMFPESKMTYVIGGMIHAVNAIVFALIHVAFYQVFGLEGALAGWGLLFGVVHWMVSGMGLGMVPMMHRGIRAGVIESPGAFASVTRMTAVGFLMAHLVYGLLVAVVYDGLVS